MYPTHLQYIVPRHLVSPRADNPGLCPRGASPAFHCLPSVAISCRYDWVTVLTRSATQGADIDSPGLDGLIPRITEQISIVESDAHI